MDASRLGANVLLSGVTFGQDQFVAVGSVYNEPVNAPTTFTSSNGVTWNPQTVPIPGYFTDIEFAEGTFVATAGDGYGSQGSIHFSTNARTWTSGYVETNQAICGVGFESGMFVAVGSSGTILTSPDHGKTWTQQDSCTTRDLYAVGFGNGTFVSGHAYGGIVTSTNGIHWNSQSLNHGNSVYGIAYGNGTFVAVGGATVLTSTNTLQWTRRSFPSTDRLNAVVYAGSTFITVDEWGMILQSGHFGLPRLGRASFNAGGFRFYVTAEQGQRYRLQTSTNPQDDIAWTDWIDHTNASDVEWFLDSATGWSQRFYRAAVR